MNSSTYIPLDKSISFEVYNLQREFLFQRNLSEFSLEVQQSLWNVLQSPKGYGIFPKDNLYFPMSVLISLETPIFLSTADELKQFDTWLNKNYNALQAKLKNNDILNDTILYVIEKLHTPEGINDIEKTIHWKYNRLLMSDKIQRKEKISKEVFIDSVEAVDVEAADDVDMCGDEVNQLTLHNILDNFLRENFHEWQVKLFLGWIVVKNTRGSNYIRTQSAALNVGRNTLYGIIKDILQRLKENSLEILRFFGEIKYPKRDEITLRNIIFD